MKTIEAIKALHTVSPNFDIWTIAGGYNTQKRQLVMSALHGKKMPISKCGVTAIRADLYAALEVTGNCEANREDDFTNKCAMVISKVQA